MLDQIVLDWIILIDLKPHDDRLPSCLLRLIFLMSPPPVHRIATHVIGVGAVTIASLLRSILAHLGARPLDFTTARCHRCGVTVVIPQVLSM